MKQLHLVLFFWIYDYCEGQRPNSIKLPFPNDEISYTQFSTMPTSISVFEYNQRLPCSFLGHGGKFRGTARCEIERIEHELVRRFIQPGCVVLELGARFGTTSCAISASLNNSGRQVSVEPDPRAWHYLDMNRKSHACNFYMVRKPVGNSAVTFSSMSNYDSTGVAVKSSKRDASLRPNFYSYTELQRAVSLTFDTLLIDCEGCINQVFLTEAGRLEDIPTLLRPVRTIIIEADNPLKDQSPCLRNCVNYTRWTETFLQMGFMLTMLQQDKKFPWIDHMVFTRSA
jgi:FkbM family methyltransferase